ncbi:hypothetical protein XELAEV_18036506mg [Xenopus laevis]|uniref:Uncharacterized protein n=1 Tax=Xenopus laevis TaxID=8355 RepID=A0A974CHI9_XENLA|nr:hypothetical protein XELAEV_18036506mg [Xenopus laevis]
MCSFVCPNTSALVPHIVYYAKSSQYGKSCAAPKFHSNCSVLVSILLYPALIKAEKVTATSCTHYTGTYQHPITSAPTIWAPTSTQFPQQPLYRHLTEYLSTHYTGT